jgi:hypothetical protein
MAEVIDYPDDPLRTFPTGDPYVRGAEFGDAGLITYLINDVTSKVIILDITWAGQLRQSGRDVRELMRQARRAGAQIYAALGINRLMPRTGLCRS